MAAQAPPRGPNIQRMVEFWRQFQSMPADEQRPPKFAALVTWDMTEEQFAELEAAGSRARENHRPSVFSPAEMRLVDGMTRDRAHAVDYCERMRKFLEGIRAYESHHAFQTLFDVDNYKMDISKWDMIDNIEKALMCVGLVIGVLSFALFPPLALLEGICVAVGSGFFSSMLTESLKYHYNDIDAPAAKALNMAKNVMSDTLKAGVFAGLGAGANALDQVVGMAMSVAEAIDSVKDTVRDAIMKHYNELQELFFHQFNCRLAIDLHRCFGIIQEEAWRYFHLAETPTAVANHEYVLEMMREVIDKTNQYRVVMWKIADRADQWLKKTYQSVGPLKRELEAQAAKAGIDRHPFMDEIDNLEDMQQPAFKGAEYWRQVIGNQGAELEMKGSHDINVYERETKGTHDTNALEAVFHQDQYQTTATHSTVGACEVKKEVELKVHEGSHVGLMTHFVHKKVKLTPSAIIWHGPNQHSASAKKEKHFLLCQIYNSAYNYPSEHVLHFNVRLFPHHPGDDHDREDEYMIRGMKKGVEDANLVEIMNLIEQYSTAGEGTKEDKLFFKISHHPHRAHHTRDWQTVLLVCTNSVLAVVEKGIIHSIIDGAEITELKDLAAEDRHSGYADGFFIQYQHNATTYDIYASCKDAHAHRAICTRIVKIATHAANTLTLQ